MRRPIAVAFVLSTLMSLSASLAVAQPQSARVLVASPIFLRPNASLTPLVTAPAGMTVTVLDLEGDWCRVQFKDRLGERTGFIQVKNVEYLQPNPEKRRPEPNVNEASSGPVSAPPRARATFGQAVYKDAQLTVPKGDETKQVDVVINFDTDRFQIQDKKTRQPLKDLPYAAFSGAEYSYSKSPRWKSGLFISPFLFLSSGRKHWLLVKTADDYAMLRLEKGNYKLILADFEMRTGIRVEAQGEDK